MPRSKALESLLKEYPELASNTKSNDEKKDSGKRTLESTSQDVKPKRQYRRKNLHIVSATEEVQSSAPTVTVQENVRPTIQTYDKSLQDKAVLPTKEKKPNKWLNHVQEVRKSNADKNYRDCLILAKSNYVR